MSKVGARVSGGTRAPAHTRHAARPVVNPYAYQGNPLIFKVNGLMQKCKRTQCDHNGLYDQQRLGPL